MRMLRRLYNNDILYHDILVRHQMILSFFEEASCKRSERWPVVIDLFHAGKVLFNQGVEWSVLG